MYLHKQKKKDGRIWLSIAESRRVDGKSKTYHLESIGYVDQLITPKCPDPIAYWKDEVARRNAELKAEHSPICFEISPLKKISPEDGKTIDVGALVGSAYFYRDLGIWNFFEKKRTARTFDFDPCRILELLVWNRISCPASKKAAFETKDSYPRKCDFSLADIYRCLSYLAKHKGALLDHINVTLEQVRGPRNTERFYYDVTNYYFEIEKEDIEGSAKRRRGVSKEHRPNPIVQMGLLLDGDGLPYHFDLFDGNTNDCETLLPVMKKADLRHVADHVIVVADKGLNSSNNIAAAILDKNGFIYSQSPRKATLELKRWVLSEKGYQKNQSETYKIKSRITTKTIRVEGEDGKRKEVDIPVKEVAFWSAKYAERAAQERACIIDKTLSALTKNTCETVLSRGSLRYTKHIAYMPDTGEIGAESWVLDEDKIERDAELDGYYCIITSELDMQDEKVVEAYRGLWKIEESFRVMKTDLRARPVYVSVQDHIEAHFLVCYIALLIMRLMQADMQEDHSAAAISKALKEMVGNHLKANYYLFSHTNPLCKDLCEHVGIELDKRIMTKGEIAKVAAQVRKPKKE